ncbi:MAG: GntR family transcriptional regulator [Planctomycetota bacterium]
MSSGATTTSTLNGAEGEHLVKTHLRRQIRAGTLSAGDRVPSQLLLANRLSVSRHAVRRALDDLQRDGLLEGLKHRSLRVASAPSGSVRAGSLLSRTVLHICSQIPYSPAQQPHHQHHFQVDIDLAFMRTLRRLNAVSLCVATGALSQKEFAELSQTPPRGVVMTSTEPLDASMARVVRPLERNGLRVVACESRDGSQWPHTFMFDHAEGGQILIEALAQRGCRRVQPIWAFTDYDRPAWWGRRNQGVERKAAELGVELSEAMDVFGFPARVPSSEANQRRWESAVRMAVGALQPLLDRRDLPDAIVCSMDYQAMVVLEALGRLGIRGDRLPLVTGYDNTWRTLLDEGWGDRPPDLTVDKNNESMGERLARAVLADESTLSDIPRAVAPCLVEPLLAS